MREEKRKSMLTILLPANKNQAENNGIKKVNEQHIDYNKFREADEQH